MIVYPEVRYEFKSEVTYQPSAVLVQVFHHIAVIRDVPDVDAEWETIEIPPEPLRIRQKDGSFIEVPRPGAKPTFKKEIVKPGYTGARVYNMDPENEPNIIDVLRQISWDFKIRRGLDAAHPYCPLIHWPEDERIVMVTHGWDGGGEVCGPIGFKPMPYRKCLEAIADVHDGADIRNAPGYTELSEEDELSIEEMRKKIEEFDRAKAAGQDGVPKTFKL